jgi:hypothetical protein
MEVVLSFELLPFITLNVQSTKLLKLKWKGGWWFEGVEYFVRNDFCMMVNVLKKEVDIVLKELAILMKEEERYVLWAFPELLFSQTRIVPWICHGDNNRQNNHERVSPHREKQSLQLQSRRRRRRRRRCASGKVCCKTFFL